MHGLRRKEAKKKIDEKLATNMANWLTKKNNNGNHEEKNPFAALDSISKNALNLEENIEQQIIQKDENVLVNTKCITDSENWTLIEPNNTLNPEDNLEQQTIQKDENVLINIKCVSDPGNWPLLTDKIRTYIVEQKPYHLDVNHYFPSNADGRHFDGKWFFKYLPNGENVRRQWLVYSVSKDALFCFPCLLFKKKNHKRKSPFCDDGFTDWQHLNPRISEHELSDFHRKCYVDWKEFEKRLKDGKTIDNNLQEVIQNEKRKWRNILKTISNVILFCAKNNLPLRGSSDKVGDDNCGIFLGLIELISQYDPLLAEHVNNVKHSYSNDKVLSYFSPLNQNELVIIMGQQVKKE